MKAQDRARYLMHARRPDHRRRVERARSILLSALSLADDDPTRVAVFTSWGSDSVPLCDLAIETLGAGVALVHLASPYEMPGGARVVDHFAARARVVNVPGSRTLEETIAWLHGIGLDCERETEASKKVGNRAKADKGTAWTIANGCAVQVLGMRAGETLSRRKLFAARGPVYRARGVVIACPMAAWSTADVWAYTVARNLPWHPLYDCEGLGFTRETLSNTGWLTTHGAASGRIAWLRRYYPDLYARLVAEWPHLRGIS